MMKVRSWWHIIGGLLVGFWGYDDWAILGAGNGLFLTYQILQEYYTCFSQVSYQPSSHKDIKEWTAALFMGYGTRWGLTMFGLALR